METVTSAPAAAGWRIMFRVSGRGDSKTKLYSAKPSAFTVSACPGRKPVMVKLPDSSERVLDATVPFAFSATEAFGTAAPRGSETVPVSCWALDPAAKHKQTNARRKNHTYPFYHTAAAAGVRFRSLDQTWSTPRAVADSNAAQWTASSPRTPVIDPSVRCQDRLRRQIAFRVYQNSLTIGSSCARLPRREAY